MSKKAYSSQEIISILKDAGFILDRVKGSHHIFLHPQNKKRAVVPHPKKDFTHWHCPYNIKTSRD